MPALFVIGSRLSCQIYEESTKSNLFALIKTTEIY